MKKQFLAVVLGLFVSSCTAMNVDVSLSDGQMEALVSNIFIDPVEGSVVTVGAYNLYMYLTEDANGNVLIDCSLCDDNDDTLAEVMFNTVVEDSASLTLEDIDGNQVYIMVSLEASSDGSDDSDIASTDDNSDDSADNSDASDVSTDASSDATTDSAVTDVTDASAGVSADADANSVDVNTNSVSAA